MDDLLSTLISLKKKIKKKKTEVMLLYGGHQVICKLKIWPP